MISLNAIAERDCASYTIDIDIMDYVLDVKWDTGAANTVISLGAIDDEISFADFTTFKNYCEQHYSKVRKEFTSASGGSFYGYPISVNEVKIGGKKIPSFLFYLVLENKRDIALLGFDFIDRCSFSHKADSNITLSEFNESGYGEFEGAMGSDEFISLIDSLSNQ